MADESILKTVRRLVGIDKDFDGFDPELISGINSAFMTLRQLGVGPKQGFLITDDSATWQDFDTNPEILAGIPQYVAMKTKLIFDPPTNSFVVTSIENQLKELEFRFNVQAEGAFNE